MENSKLGIHESPADTSETATEAAARSSCVAPDPIRTALYRHFDGEGKLLYVGISLSPTYRTSQHADGSHWFSRIARIEVEWFDNREAAAQAERNAIKGERPEHNIVHNRPNARDAYLAELAEESCAELTRKVSRFSLSYCPATAASACSMKESSMRLALQAGDLPYYPCGDRAVAVTGWALIAYIEALQAGVLSVRTNRGGLNPPPNNQALVELFRNAK